jgi:hypothetical protein
MTAVQPRYENQKVSEDVNVSETGPLKKTTRIAYRVTQLEYEIMTRIADLLFKNWSIKINSPSALARAAAFTQINIFLHFEAKEKAYKEYEAELDKRRIRSMRSYEYIPPPGSYWVIELNVRITCGRARYNDQSWRGYTINSRIICLFIIAVTYLGYQIIINGDYERVSALWRWCRLILAGHSDIAPTLSS